MAEHASAKVGLSASCPPGTLMKAYATPYPVGPIGDPVSLHHERCHAERDPEDLFALARARHWQKMQLRAEQLERSEDQLAHSSNSRHGLDIEGLGSQLRAFAAASNSNRSARAMPVRPGAQIAVGERPEQCQSNRYLNIDTTSRDGLVAAAQAALADLRTVPAAASRGGAVGSDAKAYKGFDVAAHQAALAEQLRLNLMAAALRPSMSRAVASEAKGQKGRGLKSSVPQMGMSSDSHPAVSSSSGAMLSAPPGTWFTPALPQKKQEKHAMQEPSRAREVQRSTKSAGSTSAAPMTGFQRDQLSERGGRAGGNAALDRRADYAETAQRHSKGYAAAHLNAAALKRKNREKQTQESARKDAMSHKFRDALSQKFKRCKFLQIHENTLRFDLSEEDLQGQLHPEGSEGETPCDEDVELASRSPWDFGFYDR